MLRFAIGFALLLVSSSPLWAVESKRPNIVVIMADDIGYECLGCYGSKAYPTPNIDRLAAEGVRFENAHSQPICTPSRVQIMTGIYNNRNYIRFGLLDPKAVTFANLMRDAGYETCIAGKWQLDGGFDGPRSFGFDHYCLWQLTRRPSRYPNPGLEIDGKEVDFKNGEFGPDVVSDYICDFIEKYQDKPFLVYYPMIAPHWPFLPTPDHADWDPTMWRDAKSEPGGYKGPKYWDAMVRYTDKMVGKVIDKLDELKLRENTLILWTGDNGTYESVVTPFHGREYRGGKGSTKDNGTHVGFVASWPGTIEQGKVAADLVDFSDVLPTVLEVAGVELPEKLEVDGVSLVPVFHGKDRSKPYIYCWYERNGVREKASQHTRDAQYKVYANGEIYDVVKDPLEKKDLADSMPVGSEPERIAMLRKALDKHDEITKASDAKQKKLQNKQSKK
ncbi:arylsulfatase [Blastopirellula marina]|uniref:Arylsulfatase n=1 Tax=Blastopirellula marina TaxID=124 RepID=A0A2S8FD12_9BACT|nr:MULTISPECIES: sulfatase-like hydrolase/transferase [Pirellulaceae]PQO30039.1 arylsulfatase [Blastopirellula marina]RCS50474.1 arylsulfatase [Bremerella cremea]